MNDSRNRKTSLMVGAVLALWLASPAGARAATDSAQSETGWGIRFHLVGIDYGGGGAGRDPGYGLDFGGGIGVNAEYRFSRRLGIDLGIMGGAGLDVGRASSPGRVDYRSVTFTPVTLGLDVHLTPGREIDLYVCPMLALIAYGSLELDGDRTGWETRLDFDRDLSLGAGLGLGVPIGERGWSFSASLTFFDSTLENDGNRGDLVAGDYDVTVIGLGFGYRF